MVKAMRSAGFSPAAWTLSWIAPRKPMITAASEM